VERVLEEHRNIHKLGEFLEGLAGRARIDPAVTRHGLDLLLKGMISWGGARRVVLGKGLDWYRHQDRGFSFDPLHALIDLNRRSKRTNDDLDRRAVEEVVWAAFLADLRDDFEHGRRSPYRSLNCVLLLDNADAPGGV